MNEELRGFRPTDYMNLIGKIPVFNGSRNCKEAEAWMKIVKSYKGFFKIGFNDGMFLTAIVSSFRDRAQAWWENVEEDVESWKEFEEKFNSKFLKANTDEAWNKLRSIKQSSDQDVDQFTSEINSLFKAAGICDDNMKISLFISAINVNIAYKLEKKRDDLKTYQSMVNKAVALEALLLKYKNGNTEIEKKVSFNLENNYTNKGNNGSVGNGSESLSTSSQDSLAELLQGMKQLNINLVQQQQQIKQLQEIGGPQPRQQFNRPPFGERKPLLCWNCNEEGHPSRLCPRELAKKQQVNDQGKAMGSQ